ncbi:MAG TPA: hypothetical protein PK031_02000 [Pseudomonadales bacterium]|nr:hypothetical protein [Pseudomonadales bacterium]
MSMIQIKILAASALVAFSSVTFADRFPDEIRDAANTYNCKKIEKIYNNQVEVIHDFIYENKKNKSFIFWCESNDNLREYLLIKKSISNKKTNTKCPEVIYKTTGFPQGLTITEKTVNLLDYYFVDDKKKGPDIIVKNASIIVDGDDSLSTNFICYKGRYLFNSYH